MIRSLPLLDEEIEKQPHSCQSLLKRGIRQAYRWSESRGALADLRARPPTEITHVASKVCSCRRRRRNVYSLAEAEKIIQASCVGIQSIGSESEQRFGGQPCSCLSIHSNEWIPKPLDSI